MTRRQQRELRKAKAIRIAAVVVAVIVFLITELIILTRNPEKVDSEEIQTEPETAVHQTVEKAAEIYSPPHQLEMLYASAATPTVAAVTGTVIESTEETTTIEVKIYWSEVPLEQEVQETLVRYCEEYSVPVSIALGLIEHESVFDADVISSTNDYGLCQINKCNHEWLEEQLGVTDFLDPEQNIECGMYILGTLYEKYGDWGMALICYNCGENGAKENYFDRGVYSNKYSSSVLGLSENWEAVVNE